MKKKFQTVAAAFLLCMILLTGCSGSGEIASVVFDFSDLSSNGLPIGWSTVSYENQYTADCTNGIVTLSSDVLDDCRLVREFPVSEKTRYVLEAELKTENVIGGQGAALSIDNYSVDGSYVYSDGLFGTNDWTPLELAFETAAGQKTVMLALRLGGYSNVSQGTVQFRNVSIRQTNDAAVSFQKLTTKSAKSESTSKSASEYESYFSLIFWETVLAGAVLLYGVYLQRNRLESIQSTNKRAVVIFGILVLVGLFIRLMLCHIFKGHATDMSCWIAWGNQIADGKFATFYDGTWYDYPPLYMLFLGGMTLVMRFLHVSEWGSETLRLFCYMIPAFLCDIGCGILVMRFCKENGRTIGTGLLLSGLILLNPAAIFLSGAWGQIDSVLTLLLLLSFEAFRKNRRILCGLWFALAVLTKWQALIFGPILAFVYLLTIWNRQRRKTVVMDILKTVVAVLGAFLLIFLVSLPFRGTMSPFWIVNRFLNASSGYDYATVEGYNFFALIHANWVKAGKEVLGGGSAGAAFAEAMNAAGRLLLMVSAITLGIQSIRDFRDRRGFASIISLGFIVLGFLIARTIVFIFSAVEPFAWALYGAVGIVGLLGWLLQTASPGTLLTYLKENETAFYGTATAVLSLAVPLFTWLLMLVFRLFGAVLTYYIFGTLMIAVAGIAAVWILWRFHRAYILCTENPELLYLTSACFMLWVFTFGHYMHERYVFPVLILLLFAYAWNRDKRILLSAILLSITTFLNEQVAMYVVSKGAIDAIRGGERHNLFITVCSAMEVLTSLYLTAVVFRKQSRLGKGGDIQ